VKLVSFFFVIWISAAAFATGGGPVEWKPWSDDIFATAKKENRFVILYLEAVWCHWCHVMDEKTYRDPKVVTLIRAKYLPVRVDQDSRPDLSARYEDYGWPATIVFDGTGQEIVKRRGYIEPANMASLLQAIIDDPTPGPSVLAEKPWKVPGSAFLPAALEKKLRDEHRDAFDAKLAGWGRGHKYLDWDAAEWSMTAEKAGETEEGTRVKRTLDQEKKLIDPVWGGVYQYSVDGWDEPHFEKLLRFQAEVMRIYSLAYARWGDKSYLAAAEKIASYVDGFLTSPDGAFYVSQDADLKKGEHGGGYFKKKDAARRKLGMPAIDKNLYARENGWMIQGLVQLYAASGKSKYLDQAKRATVWVQANLRLVGGGFRHGGQGEGGPFLDDSLAMGRAFLALHGATGDRGYLAGAQTALDFILNKFPYKKDGAEIGFANSAVSAGVLAPRPNRDENFRLARFANLMHQFTGKEAYRMAAESAMKYLAVPEVAEAGTASPILLANWELQNPPLHMVVVGKKEDGPAKDLFAAALAYPSLHTRLEWWDKREGNLANQDVTYPELPKSAAFVCTGQRCSLPIFDAAQLRAKVDRLLDDRGTASAGTN